MKITAFISQKGGVGKSTLSQVLAVEAKKKEFNVLFSLYFNNASEAGHKITPTKKNIQFED